jgi:hypothetical protein
MLGRAGRDLIPDALDQLMSYFIHREMMASHASSASIETVFARFDGTVFKCVFSASIFSNSKGMGLQEMMMFLLDTVEDLSHLVPKLDEPLPRHAPVVSLEVDYHE